VITRQAPRQARLFTTSIRYQKSAVEIGKDALKKVDRAVSDAAVKGIETGETVVEKTKETIGTDKGEVKGNAKEAAGEIKGEVKGKAHEVAGQAKGKAEEVKGK
ncbi:hypothetical protein EJ08DRAFT_573642, partial [Tothia fuscella]